MPMIKLPKYWYKKNINILVINQNVTFTTNVPHILLALVGLSLTISHLHYNTSNPSASHYGI